MKGKIKLKQALFEATHGCAIQHTGWPCGTCFFAIDKSLTNADWQNVLLIRGDSAEKDLHNLPKDREASLNKILLACKKADELKVEL